VVGKEVPPSTEVLRPPESPDETGEFSVVRTPPSEGDTARAFIRHSAVMSVGTGLSRITGFLRLAAMAYALGVAESRLADSFNVANTTPNIVYELALGGIISSVFIPVFVHRLEKDGRDAAWQTARATLTFTLLLLGTVALIAIVFSGPIIKLYTFRVPAAQRDAERALASFLLKWFMPQIVFYGLGAGVATGLLNAHRRFAMPMFAPIVNNVIATATFFTFAALPGPMRPTPDNITDLQRYVLAIGTTLGVVGMTVVLWPSLRRVGFRWRWTADLRDPGFRRIGRLAGWALLYVVINQVGYVVVIILAQGVQGGYTAYTSAFIFFQLPYAIFAVSIMTALLPSLSSRWSDSDPASFRVQLAQGIRGTAFIVVPAAFGYLAMATPIVRLLLQHGVTRASSTVAIAHVLVFFSIGLLSFCSFQLMLRAFYAMQDTRTPAVINVFAVGINIVADIILFQFLKVQGLALGHALAYTFAATVTAVLLRRRLGGLEGKMLGPALAKIALGGLAAGGAALIVSRGAANALGVATLSERVAQVAAGVLAGGAAFILVAAAFGLPELAVIRSILLTRLRRR
jgi:putative peptidoglycan lipid II flippase